jgi:hypothetical protein
MPRRPVRVCCRLKFSAAWNDAEHSCGLGHELCLLVTVACLIFIWEVPDGHPPFYFRGFSQSHKASSGIMLQLGHGCFARYSSHYIIH